MTKPLAVVDTNLWISAAIFPQKSQPGQLLRALKANKFSLVTSIPLLEELHSVLARPIFANKYHVSPTKRENICTYIQKLSQVVQIKPTTNISIRDEKDLIVLATALEGKADYLVTGDKDLLVLNKHPNIHKLKIVTADQFLLNLNY